MAIMLAERGIGSLVALVQAQLVTILDEIDADRGDFAVPKPTDADVVGFERRERGTHDSSVNVEVFDTDGIPFTHPYLDVQNNGRAVYELAVMVRATVFNNGGWSEAQMHLIRHRYEAALKILIVRNATLDDSDDATQVAVVNRISSTSEQIQGVDAVVATAEVIVACEEVNS